VDPDAAAYIAAIPSEHRPLFDRVHRLVVEACPDAEVAWSYKMPTYRVGKRRLHVGVWAHGLSLYGWKATGDGGFALRHPGTRTSTGTIRLRSDDAADIEDDDIRALAAAVLRG
jgi:uncharacterized protein YdhG (YjbR/CyaY superfamily)